MSTTKSTDRYSNDVVRDTLHGAETKHSMNTLTTDTKWFVSSGDGHLYDTSRSDWSHQPAVRRDYAKHFREIANGRQLKACLRAGEFAWPGGYTLYFITSDGGVLSYGAVRKKIYSVLSSIHHKVSDGWQVVALASTSEDDEQVVCDHTGEVLHDPNE